MLNLYRPILGYEKEGDFPSRSAHRLSSLIDSISLVSCVDELDQLPIRFGVANELSGVTPQGTPLNRQCSLGMKVPLNLYLLDSSVWEFDVPWVIN